MTNPQLKQHLKELADEYIYLGKTSKTINQFSNIKDKEAARRRAKKGLKNQKMTVDEKITSTSNGSLCLYILGLLNGEEMTNG